VHTKESLIIIGSEVCAGQRGNRGTRGCHGDLADTCLSSARRVIDLDADRPLPQQIKLVRFPGQEAGQL